MEKTVKLTVTGMSCGGCALTVEGALEQVAGVKEAEVDHKAGTAVVFFDRDIPDTESLLKAVREAGYSGGLSS